MQNKKVQRDRLISLISLKDGEHRTNERVVDEIAFENVTNWDVHRLTTAIGEPYLNRRLTEHLMYQGVGGLFQSGTFARHNTQAEIKFRYSSEV